MTQAKALNTARVGDGGRPSTGVPVVLLLSSLLLMVAWALAVPIFEAPDEPAHWQYARYLHDHGRLPVFGPEFVEANSPPLYYLLIAPFASAGDEPPPLAFHTAEGQLILPAPPRFFQNSAEDLHRYWRIRSARLVSVLMSTFTVWLCFLAGAEASGRYTTGLIAAGLVAFLPQFTFRSANVSNDSLVTLFSAASLYLTIRLIRRGFTWRGGSLLAAAVAGAFLSKINAIFLPVPVALAIVTEPGVPLGRRLGRLSVLAVALVLVIPWTLRNQLLYGDPLASAAMESAVGPIVVKKSIWSPYFLDVFPSLLSRSFVGVFGWMNVILPDPVYWLFGLLGAVALLGCAIARLRGDLPDRLLLILCTFPILSLAIVVHINLTFSQPQGRYLFPALPAAAVLAAVGLESAAAWSRRRAVVLVTGLAGLNVAILLLELVPVYWPPPVSRISNARTALQATKTQDAVPTHDGERFRVAGKDPALFFDIDVDAEDYSFLQFDIEGRAQGGVRLGAAYFSGDRRGLAEEDRIPFTWTENDRPQTVTVPLFPHRKWRGRIKRLRIDPIDVAAEARTGMTVSVANVVLKGRLDPLPPSRASIGPRKRAGHLEGGTRAKARVG